MKLIRFTIKNRSPGMLQNPATEELLKALRTKTPQQPRTDWTVSEEAGTKLYRSERGYMGFPTQNLMSAIKEAGRHVKSGAKPISTNKNTTIYDFLEFVEDFCEFDGCVEQKVKDGEPKFDVEWKPMLMKGNLKQKGNSVAVCITRPRIPHWQTSFTVRFDDKRGISQDTLIKLIDTAGRKTGLCDFRPGCGGRFGRFKIEKVAVLPLDVAEEKIEVVEYTPKNAPAELLELAGV